MKRILCLLFSAVLLLSVCLPVAANEYGMPLEGAGMADWAELLSNEEEGLLNARAAALWRQHGLNIAIVTTAVLDGKTPRHYAQERYEAFYGKGSDGILFLLSMEDRDWYVFTDGRATELYTYDEIGDSVDEILHYLSDGAYYEGFSAWLEGLPYYLGAAEPEPQPSLLLALVIGVFAALITVLLMRSAMNTKRQQSNARQYLTAGSYRLRIQRDIYLYSRVTRAPRPKSSGSGGGGGGRGGRGGKF